MLNKWIKYALLHKLGIFTYQNLENLYLKPGMTDRFMLLIIYSSINYIILYINGNYICFLILCILSS